MLVYFLERDKRFKTSLKHAERSHCRYQKGPTLVVCIHISHLSRRPVCLMTRSYLYDIYQLRKTNVIINYATNKRNILVEKGDKVDFFLGVFLDVVLLAFTDYVGFV